MINDLPDILLRHRRSVGLAAILLAVASTQHFRGWAKIMGGEFSWDEQWYVNAWVLSGFAIFILTALLLLIWRWQPPVIAPAGGEAEAAAETGAGLG